MQRRTRGVRAGGGRSPAASRPRSTTRRAAGATEGDQRRFWQQLLNEAYCLPNWNGTNLRGAVQRVTPAMAGWRPPHVQHSIAEIVLHCAYWKYALRRKLSAGQRGGFSWAGSNWFPISDEIDGETWRGYRQLLDEEHRQLVEVLQSSPQALDLVQPQQDGRWNAVQRIAWLAIHDGYHTGQINLLKAMYRRADRERLTRKEQR